MKGILLIPINVIVIHGMHEDNTLIAVTKLNSNFATSVL